ncbi:Anticodon-binding domain protein [Cryptosporidium meleagridis]|uniref:Anticodon-binding domain protein n=1 Tax=Cryptosporidium meleagridis TaxID=93969 RepID=A0A2P4YX93_9CRYT|nr:Anticodon-binding domain protein [Cryptosporidium meleagridis]
MLDQISILDAISIRTNKGEVLRGQVCCTFPNNQFIVLKKDVRNGFSTFDIINSESIIEVKPYSEGKCSEINVDLPKNYVDIIKKREEVVISNAKSNIKYWGNNVTPMGQATFDFIHKTHPNCLWNNENIEVMGITVSPPYLPENCSGDDKRALERIRCVIEKFRERISGESH